MLCQLARLLLAGILGVGKAPAGVDGWMDGWIVPCEGREKQRAERASVRERGSVYMCEREWFLVWSFRGRCTSYLCIPSVFI